MRITTQGYTIDEIGGDLSVVVDGEGGVTICLHDTKMFTFGGEHVAGLAEALAEVARRNGADAAPTKRLPDKLADRDSDTWTRQGDGTWRYCELTKDSTADLREAFGPLRIPNTNDEYLGD